jgi:hypothetical protein
MPTAITETDAFPATLQRPNNGELADVASLLLFAQGLANRSRYAYNRSRTGFFDVRRAPFNAVGNGVADDHAAIDAAISAAASAGAGIVVLPAVVGGAYRSSAGFSLPPNVSIFFDQTVLRLDNPTADWFTLISGPNNGVAQFIEGASFDGFAGTPSTGTLVYCPATIVANMVLRNCSSNRGGIPLHQGRAVRWAEATAKLTLEGCDFVTLGTLPSLDIAAGIVRVVGGSLSMPATYASDLISIGGGPGSSGDVSLDGVRFDLTAHSGGGLSSGANVTSTYGRLAARDCKFDATGATGAQVAFKWTAGAFALIGQNRYFGGITPFYTSEAGLNSDLTLQPTKAINVAGAANFALPVGFRSLLVKSTNTSGTDLQMPAGLFPGQVLELTYYNASASAVATSFFGAPGVTGTTIPTITAGNTLTGTFVFEDRDVSGTYRWVQKGTWGVGLTLLA